MTQSNAELLSKAYSHEIHDAYEAPGPEPSGLALCTLAAKGDGRSAIVAMVAGVLLFDLVARRDDSEFLAGQDLYVFRRSEWATRLGQPANLIEKAARRLQKLGLARLMTIQGDDQNDPVLGMHASDDATRFYWDNLRAFSCWR